MKRISTTANDISQYCEELQQRFATQGYKSEILDKQIKLVKKNRQERTLKSKRQYHLKRNKSPTSINI